MRQLSAAWVLRAVGVRWPAIGCFVLLDVACFYELGVFAMGTANFVWMSAHVGAMVFGPVIWREHQRVRSKAALLRERQPEKEREEQRRNLEELQRGAQRQQQAQCACEAEQLSEAEEDDEAQRLQTILCQAREQLRESAQCRCEEEKERQTQRQHESEQPERLRQAQQQRREAEQRWRQAEEEREAQKERQRRRKRGATHQMDWWIVLGVAPSASKDEIVRKYRYKIKQYHPDRVVGLAPELLQLAEEQTKALNAAYANAMRTRGNAPRNCATV
jgi:DnaJ-domain-containing protein 1